MKYQKLVSELDDVLDAAERTQLKRRKKIKTYLARIEEEEHALRKKLRTENNKARRMKLKNKLRLVDKGYEMLSAINS